MILETFPVGPLQSNCTILGDEVTREAIVVDPGADAETIHHYLVKQGLTLKQILVTHAHLDHVGGAVQLKKLTGAPVYLNEKDIPLLESMKSQAAMLGMRAPETAPPDEYLSDGKIVGLAGCTARVLHTPGHTQGSVCLYFEQLKLVIAADTLFAGSIGRTDLPGGNYTQIIDSIKTRLMTLPDETQVITGHGPSTTIGDERRWNPFLK